MGKVYRDLAILTGFCLTLTLLIWLPFFLKVPSFYGLNFSQGFPTIYQNFDGLEYIIIAKTAYNPQAVLSLPSPLPPNYFASHFPLYPITIAAFAPFLGYLKSMLFVSLAFTVLSSFIFYLLVSDLKLTRQPLWLSCLFLVLPARWVIVHSVGSPEPMFIFFTLAAIYFGQKFSNLSKAKFIWLAALAAAFAQLTRPPGILVFAALIAFAIFSHWPKLRSGSIRQILNYYPLLLVPLALLATFYWFQLSLGDFYAYFHSGDNIHLTFPPFQVFNKHQFWVGDIWLEDIIYIFILGTVGGLMLLRSPLPSAGFFVLTYLLATSLIAHRDISRYILPISPFVLIAFDKVLASKEFKIAFGLIFLAIYLYSQNFIIENVAPVAILSTYN